MPSTTVLALFKDKRDAEAAVRALKSAHFDSARLGVVEPRNAHVQAFGQMAVAGVGAGTIVCGVVGVALGTAVAGGVPRTPAPLPRGGFGALFFWPHGPAHPRLRGDRACAT